MPNPPGRRWDGRTVKHKAAEVESVYGNICWLCHKPIVGQVSPDHVVPRSQGGTDDIDNLRPSHRWCNTRRGARRPIPPTITNTEW